MRKTIVVVMAVLWMLLLLLSACGKSETADKPIKAYVEFGGAVKEYEVDDYWFYSGGEVKLQLKDGSRILTHIENVMLVRR